MKTSSGESAARPLYRSPDVRLLFATRITRLFGYGFLSVVLVLYLAELGFSDSRIGLLLTLTLLGDTFISLGITTSADRIGRKKMLLTGAFLVVFAGALFALSRSFFLLLIAATVGVISPSGSEVGPFLSIEQASLSQLIREVDERTRVFAWYNLVGSFSTALGSLAGGFVVQAFHDAGYSTLASYRVVIAGYSAVGVLLALLFSRLTPLTESTHDPAAKKSVSPITRAAGSAVAGRRQRLYRALGLSHSGPVVARLAALFSLDAFAGGFVLQSIVAYWFHVRYQVEPALLGAIFFGGNILAGISALSAGWLSRRIGLIRTMVFTHLPSNVLLMLVPLMPNLPLAIAMLLFRFSISQMDVPTRQSYTMAVVHPAERSSAGGVTGVARSAGSSLAPALAGALMNASMFSMPFFIAGSLKIVYDLMLYRSFRAATYRNDD